jgi:N-acetylmuramoyl-L-alanine amidase
MVFIKVSLRATFLVVTCAFLALGSCGAKSGRAGIFSSASKALDEVAKNDQYSIPDAVLDRTQCLIVIPANRDQGAESCRETPDRWTSPTLVTFRGERAKKSDLLVLVLGEKEARKLRSGVLEIGGGSSASPGPVARSKSEIKEADLRSGSVLYERKGKTLSGASARGSVSPAESQGASPSAKDEKRIEWSIDSFFNVITPSGIIIHHTAVLPDTQKTPSNKKEVDKFHSEEGFDTVCFGKEYHIAYHYLILPNGSIKEGRPDRCQGAHAKGYNDYLGISVVGDFSSKDNPGGEKGPEVPNEAQQQSLVKLCRKLQAEYKIPTQHILRHSDVAATQCPGDRFPFAHIMQMLRQ